VRLVVPFGPGAAIDTLSRAVAQPFPQFANGRALVVENHGDAGGTIAGGVAATSRPDGYTLVTADLGAIAVGKGLIPTLSYEPLCVFTPIVHLVNLPLVLILRERLEARDIPGLVALSKRARGGPSYSTSGVGHPTHLTDELLVRTAGINATAVHYRSGSDVQRSLLQGETDFGFVSFSTAMLFMREGKVRPIAAASAPRPSRPCRRCRPPPRPCRASRPPPGTESSAPPAEIVAASIRKDAERWTPVIRAAGIRAAGIRAG
jgi:tripartite-type tricarboxylate transporter receptor subunit TctC